jgi:hypothetical protein
MNIPKIVFITKKYITHTRKGENRTSVEEITHYTINGEVYEKSDFFQNYFDPKDETIRYYSKNEDASNDTALCEVKTSIKGEKYFKTVSTSTVTDNLLKLPHC